MKRKEPAAPPVPVGQAPLSVAQIQRGLFEGMADRALRTWYETDEGTSYLVAKMNARAIKDEPAQGAK